MKGFKTNSNVTEYDEEVEGFSFTRAKSRKPRDFVANSEPPGVHARKLNTEPVQEDAEPVEEQPSRGTEAAITVPIKKKARNKMSFSTPNVKAEKPRRRSKRLSNEQEPEDNLASPQPKGRPRLRDKGPARSSELLQAPAVAPREKTPAVEEDAAVVDDKSATKIALPFADTPVIRRNKAMREGKVGSGERRSSLGMRGRRASSLIESGTSNGAFAVLLSLISIYTW